MYFPRMSDVRAHDGAPLFHLGVWGGLTSEGGGGVYHEYRCQLSDAGGRDSTNMAAVDEFIREKKKRWHMRTRSDIPFP